MKYIVSTLKWAFIVSFSFYIGFKLGALFYSPIACNLSFEEVVREALSSNESGPVYYSNYTIIPHNTYLILKPQRRQK